MEQKRTIISGFEPFFRDISVKIQVPETTGLRRRRGWVTIHSADYIDPEDYERALLQEHGSPVIIYDSDRVEPGSKED